MVFRIQTCTNWGLETHAVLCEVDLSNQLPSFSLVGLPSSITQESKERVRSAIANSGLEWPEYKVTINLLPAHLPKWGSHYELAMALGVLGTNYLKSRNKGTVETGAGFVLSLQTSFFAVGELSLTGEVRPTRWLGAAQTLLCESASKTKLCVLAHPDDVHLLEALPFSKEGLELIPVQTLQEASAIFLQRLEKEFLFFQKNGGKEKLGAKPLPSKASEKVQKLPLKKEKPQLLKEVKGEPLGVMGALLASHLRLHALFVGPQGCGKSMLVRAICELLPSLGLPAQAQRQSLFSLFSSSFLPDSSEKPVVHLQTSATRASLEGSLLSNGQLVPGELTRAHFGVLVADELLEFRRDTLECLRQPIEEKIVRLQRAKFRTTLPCEFQLLASANLCPCGDWGKARGECRCHRPRVKEYQKKLSGPLLDRFDLVLFIGEDRRALFFESLSPETKALASEILRQELWEVRLKNLSEKYGPTVVQAKSLSHVPAWVSHRGAQKVACVKHALKIFVGPAVCEKFSNYAFEELALALRQDLAPILKDGKRKAFEPVSAAQN